MREQEVTATAIAKHAVGVTLDFDGWFVAVDIGDWRIEFLGDDRDQTTAREHPEHALETGGEQSDDNGDQTDRQSLDEYAQCSFPDW